MVPRVVWSVQTVLRLLLGKCISTETSSGCCTKCCNSSTLQPRPALACPLGISADCSCACVNTVRLCYSPGKHLHARWCHRTVNCRGVGPSGAQQHFITLNTGAQKCTWHTGATPVPSMPCLRVRARIAKLLERSIVACRSQPRLV